MSAVYSRILIPLDGSDFSARAMPHAQELAQRFNAELIVFQAIQPPAGYLAAGDPSSLTTVAVAPDTQDLSREVETAKRMLDGRAAELRNLGIRAKTVVEVGNPAEAIIDYAADHAVDLIVMSTHGRSGLARWAFGSVAGKVIQAAACPVLTIRPKPTR